MECLTLYRYENGLPIYKPKISFNTLDDAIKQAKRFNSNDHVIHKVVAYKCKVCFKYHLGRNGKELKDKDRERYKIELKCRIH